MRAFRLRGARLRNTGTRWEYLARLRENTENTENGGEKGDRTLDLRLMSPALYQLSYLASNPLWGQRVHMIPKKRPLRQ